MKKLMIFIVLLMVSNITIAQEKLFLLFEFMQVDNEQEAAYRDTEEFWEKIHKERVKAGDIIGWDLWLLSPGGEQQGFQYLTVALYSDPIKMMDGSSWEHLMDRAKAAYPDMTETDLDKKLNHSSETRDLAVRIFTEEIATTKGEFDMPIGTVAQIDMMKVSLENCRSYEKAEKEIFQPIHQKTVDAGGKANWGLVRFISPIGSDAYASHMTVSMFKDYKQVLDEYDNWNKAAVTPNKAIEDGLSLRDLKYVYMANLIRKVR
ncbi:hypothetical protein [Arenibacter certesii]|uniref:Uncharacterized protein n=1 Tax=Arenibacter certesii TaxID=228955 RepID=A0A918J2Z7_9FLAO|nr:hypothetical protein [Arenibacter certesii]GGW40418.1 hypothetical protein GCM10007383_26420 [Arenibacter certesii]